VKIQLQVRVGAVAMTLGELMAARENAVLALDRAVDQPVDLVLEGRTVARGQLVAVDEHFAVRITELPLALKL
jgi:flagellar motor switch protein FliN/FliY